MSYKVFIDGQHGTTGLQILDRLAHHDKVEVLHIATEKRKDLSARKALMAESDITFLCLPDDAAREAAAELAQLNTRVIDASTAHRCHPDWVYGLPELNAQQREKIRHAQRVANPGCYATGAILLLNPLVQHQLITPEASIHLNGYSGYSGGGNTMIANYESANPASAFALYGLTFQHKHLPEIIQHSGLAKRPTFFPSVVNVKQGMLVLAAFDKAELNASVADVKAAFAEHYRGETFVQYREHNPAENFLHIEGLANTNHCEVYVLESPDKSQVLLVSKFDNLGKGASGAAVQNMNIMLNIDEQKGLL